MRTFFNSFLLTGKCKAVATVKKFDNGKCNKRESRQSS
jgi:hypothetical protein